MESINDKTTTASIIIPKAEIEAVQSVMPSEITTPRIIRRVSGPGDSFAGCLHVVLYYFNSNGDVDSGSYQAGWMKESLSGALTWQPLLAGRLQSDVDGFSVVSNDSGARLVEARIEVALSDFLGGFSKRDEAEAELVYWRDVAQIDPQFYPLFYFQVTKFKCGGYSLGISCSILLADLLMKESFFKKWSEIHNSLLQKNGVFIKPLFYLPNLKKYSTPTLGDVFSNDARKDCGQTILFNVISTEKGNEFSKLAMLCVNEAEVELRNSSATELVFFIFPSDPQNISQIGKVLRCELAPKPITMQRDISRSSWEIFGGDEIEFLTGNRPVCLSHWIGSVSTELVLGIPCCYDELGTNGLRIIIVKPPHN